MIYLPVLHIHLEQGSLGVVQLDHETVVVERIVIDEDITLGGGKIHLAILEIGMHFTARHLIIVNAVDLLH